MKKIVTLLLVLSLQTALSQEEKLTVNFENTPLAEALSNIEKKTGYHFFFVDDWLNGIMVSGDYDKADLSTILSEILADTQLNFYIAENNRIILTRNNIIYDKLPLGFFRIPEEEPEEEVVTREPDPVFYQNQQQPETREIETIRIGKQSTENSGDRFLLRGIILEKETGRPIPNLVVSVKNKNINAVTEADGSYEIRLPSGLNILQTQSLGNEDVTKRVFIYNDGTLNLTLARSLESLDEIFLEGKQDANVESAVTGTEVIDIEETKNIPLVLGERNIFKIAMTLPGISSAGEGAAGFNVRGGRADQNLILLDGGVIYNPTHFLGIFSALNAFTIDQATVYKGSIPARFGGRLSSVFDIKTKDGNTKKFSGQASIGPVTGKLALEIPIVENKSSLLIGGRGAYSNWLLRELDEESLKNSEASFYDALVNYSHQINKNNKIEATGYFSRDVFSITSDSLYSYNNRLFSMEYSHTFNDRSNGSILFSNSNYKFNIDYESQFANNFTSGYNINESALKVNLNYDLNEKNTFTYGISSKLYMVDPGFIEPLGSESIVNPVRIPEEKGLESAVYFSDEFKFNEKLLFNAGIRYSIYAALGSGIQTIYAEGQPKSEASIIGVEEYGNFEVIETYGGPEVRISGRYLITPDLSVKASYNSLYQYIHTLTNNTTISPTDTYKLSNLNIEPKRAHHFSLGFYRNFNQNMYETSIVGYFRKSKNIIDFKVGADLFLNQNIERDILSGEGRSYGIEFLIKKTEGKLNGWLGYSYSRSMLKLDSEFEQEIVNNGEYFPSNFDKPHDLSLVANYKLTQRFSFSANFIYQTGRPVTIPIGKYFYAGSEQVVYSDRNEFRIPDYYRLDLSFNVEGNHRIDKLAHSFWTISVYNVLGRNNPYSVFFVNRDGEIQAMKSSIFAVPIPTITYNLKF